MADTKYSYTISTGFPNGKVISDNLKTEITESTITKALSKIIKIGDVLDIYFKDALSAGEKTILDGDVSNPAGGLIADHDNVTIVHAPHEVIISNNIGGISAAFDGHNISATQNQIKHSDMVMQESLYLQGAHISYVECQLGDYAQLSMLNPYGQSNPQSQVAQDETVVSIATNKGMFYDPLNTTYGSPNAKMEFYDNAGNFKFSIKVDSVSGDDITLVSGVPEVVDTDWIVKCDIHQFHIGDSGFQLLGTNIFQYFQPNSFTDLIQAGLVFCVRLFTNNVDAGTRKIAMNYIFRK